MAESKEPDDPLYRWLMIELKRLLQGYSARCAAEGVTAKDIDRSKISALILALVHIYIGLAATDSQLDKLLDEEVRMALKMKMADRAIEAMRDAFVDWVRQQMPAGSGHTFVAARPPHIQGPGI